MADKVVRQLVYFEQGENGQPGTTVQYDIGSTAANVTYGNSTVKSYLDSLASGGSSLDFNNDGSILISQVTQTDPEDPSTKHTGFVESNYKIGPETEQGTYAKLLKDFNSLKTEFNTLKSKVFDIKTATVQDFGFRLRYTLSVDKDLKNITFTFDRNTYGFGVTSPSFSNSILHIVVTNSINKKKVFEEDVNIKTDWSITKACSASSTVAGHYLEIAISSNDTNSLVITQGAAQQEFKINAKGTASSKSYWIAGTFKGQALSNRTNNLLNYNLVDLFYPIGSIYMSTKYYHPGTLFGGTWEPIKGRMLIGDMGNDNWNSGIYQRPFRIGQTGGDCRLPSHKHNVSVSIGGVGTALSKKTINIDASGKGYNVLTNSTSLTTATKSSAKTDTSLTGSGTSGNLPPYHVVYMWKRTG